MSITVEDHPSALLDLLWVREAYGLQPRGHDLPPALADSPAPVSDSTVPAATRSAWEEAWPRICNAAVAHAGAETDPRQVEELERSALGSVERAEVLQRLMGPTWRDEFGASAFDNYSYDAWIREGMDRRLQKTARRFEDHPERRDLTALIPAWRAGLTRLVTIPCVGAFTQKISPHALLMTDATRENSDTYRRALNSFK
ncbi:hypothetical protein [Arthrobacter pigmenti]